MNHTDRSILLEILASYETGTAGGTASWRADRYDKIRVLRLALQRWDIVEEALRRTGEDDPGEPTE